MPIILTIKSIPERTSEQIEVLSVEDAQAIAIQHSKRFGAEIKWFPIGVLVGVATQIQDILFEYIIS